MRNLCNLIWPNLLDQTSLALVQTGQFNGKLVTLPPNAAMAVLPPMLQLVMGYVHFKKQEAIPALKKESSITYPAVPVNAARSKESRGANVRRAIARPPPAGRKVPQSKSVGRPAHQLVP